MVVTARPATAAIGSTQQRVAEPSMCTVQAPQSAMPQPYLVPVRPSLSRSTHRRGMSSGASTWMGSPLRVKLIIRSYCRSGFSRDTNPDRGNVESRLKPLLQGAPTPPSACSPP